MKSLHKKIFSIFIAIIIIINSLFIISSAANNNFPVFSINIVSETDTSATVSINLDSGSFEYVTFYLIPNNNITACTAITKSLDFQSAITNYENNGNTVIVATNPSDYMVTIASTCNFSTVGSYFEFELTKSESTKLTQSDVTISVSDIGATFVNNLPYGYGDINFDSKINLADAILILKKCNNTLELSDEQLYWADVNRDETVDSKDAYWILKHYCGDIDEFSSDLTLINIFPIFTIKTVYENETKSVLALHLDRNNFVNGTFTFNVNPEKCNSFTITRSDYFKELAVDITDNGGYTLFNVNGNTVSLASTQLLSNANDYIYITVNKTDGAVITNDDISCTADDITATIRKNIVSNSCNHNYITIINDATCTSEGLICEICDKCNDIKNTITLPKLIQKAKISGSNIIGIAPGTTKEQFIEDNFYSTTAKIEFEGLNNNYICTDTVITVTNYNDYIESYSVIIYGDVNCDGFYDGTDATLVKCLNAGMLSQQNFTENAYAAADCNHDNVIDELDALILENAGLMLDEINQTRDRLTLQSLTSEYQNLILQTPSADINQNETDNEIIEENEQKLTTLSDIFIDICARIIALFKILSSILY